LASRDSHRRRRSEPGSLRKLGLISPPKVSMRGMTSRRMCTEKLCRCMKFQKGSFVQVGNRSAAVVVGMQITYRKLPTI
jgi:hypothetical protein